MTTYFKIASTFITIFLVGCISKSADDYIIEANEAAKSGNFSEALTLIDKAIKKDPKDRGAFLDRGFCHEHLKDYSAAIDDYNKLLKIDPNNIAAFYNIGTCKFELNEVPQAIEYYNKALRAKGYSTDTSSADKPRFTVVFTSQIGEDANFDAPLYEIIYKRGLAYYQLDDFKNAFEDFDKCLIVDEYKLNSQYMIALCFIESGNTKRGCEELDRSISLGDTAAIRKKQEICK